MAESMQVPGSMAAGSVLFSFLGKKHAEVVFEPDEDVAAAEVPVENLLAKSGRRKRQSIEPTGGSSGRYQRPERILPGERDYAIAVDATLRQAAARHAAARNGRETEKRFNVTKDDLRKKLRSRTCNNLIVFVVDASGSMGKGSQTPMKAAKGAVLAILRKAHQSKSRVALVAFGGPSATLILPPTSSVALAESALRQLPAGGATPFADSLIQAWRLIRSERLKDPGIRPVLVIISDGEANVPLVAGAEPQEELEALACKIAHARIPAIFIDVAAPGKRGAAMQRIAAKMQASCISMNQLSPSSILKAALAKESSQIPQNHKEEIT
ncbi:MAG: VWA domain-containing protein [Acidobacteriota bacterium]|nr:VWA domain-containing protein [Acidobacteriota bacterium]